MLLDLYGTLVEPDWAAIWATRDALAARAGVPVEAARRAWDATHRDRMLGRYGHLPADIAAVLASAREHPLRLGPALLAALAGCERASWERAVHRYPDVLPTLQRLRGEGIPTAIVTNASAEAASVIPALGLDRLVDRVFVSCEAGILKPELLERARRELGAPPSRTLLVDDDPEQVASARAMGMEAIRVERAREGRGRAAGTMPPGTLADLTALPGLARRAEPGPLG